MEIYKNSDMHVWHPSFINSNHKHEDLGVGDAIGYPVGPTATKVRSVRNSVYKYAAVKDRSFTCCFQYVDIIPGGVIVYREDVPLTAKCYLIITRVR